MTLGELIEMAEQHGLDRDTEIFCAGEDVWFVLYSPESKSITLDGKGGRDYVDEYVENGDEVLMNLEGVNQQAVQLVPVRDQLH